MKSPSKKGLGLMDATPIPWQLIRLLRESGGYISGEKISSELGITRAAVWKKIEALREKGFIIEAVPSKGYRLIKPPDLSAEEILAGICGAFWKGVLFYEKIDSTNELASALSIKRNLDSGTVIIADMQEKGKGRMGRSWVSPPGLNIYMSIVLRPELGPRDSTLLTIIPALACAAAVRSEAGLDIMVKWPNDLVVQGKKLGGILTELKTDLDKIHVAIIGIGLNVNMTGRDFPEEIRPIATSMREVTGKLYSRSAVIIGILREIEYLYAKLKTDGKEAMLAEWRRVSSILGKKVNVSFGNEIISGIAEELDNDGMLILRLPSGAMKRMSAGDVTIMKS